MRAEGPALRDLDRMAWVGDIPVAHATQHPARAAIIMPERGITLTYAGLAEATSRFAAVMWAHGLRPGDRIAYLGRNSDLFFAALFGCIAGRFILVPLNWRCAAPEIALMLADSEAVLLIGDEAFLSGLDPLACPRILPTESPNGLRVTLDAQAAPVPAPSAGHDPDQPCLLLYTSGTTGRPKGVVITHAAFSISRHAETISPDWADWTEGDVILSPLPSFHIGGLAWMLIGLIRGLTCVLTAEAGAPALLDAIDRYGVTRIFIVPTVLRALLDHLRETGRAPPALAAITYGASAMGESLLREAIATLGCQFAQHFGMTEAAGTVCFLPPADHDPARPDLLTTVGRPQCGMAVEIRNAAGALCPRGHSGEIWVRSPALMSGYWRQAEATRAAIVDGWYRTGDGGRLDEGGYLTLTDRIRDMIISGGENIYPAQVEEVLRQHPAVRDVAVVGVADERWGERVVAVVERQGNEDMDVSALIDFAQVRLARYKCPKAIWIVDTLPRTALGKIQRSIVRGVAAANSAGSAS